MAVARHLLLNTGARIPTLALGTYLSAGQDVQQAVDYALHKGYRHIDTARTYGNEGEIGDVLHNAFTAGSLKREQVFISTKVPPVYLAPHDVEKSIEESLDSLRLDYVDMLLIHNPCGLQNVGNIRGVNEKGERVFHHNNLVEAWRGMEHVMKKGLTKAIGLSNFNRRQIDDIWQKCTIKPANLQSECHAYLQQSNLRAYCQEKNIVMTTYSPFGSPGFHSAPENAPVLMEDPVLHGISTRLKRPISQILLRFLLQLGVIPLPKSINRRHIKDNSNVYDFSLAESDMKLLGTLHRDLKYFTFPYLIGHPEYPGIDGEAF